MADARRSWREGTPQPVQDDLDRLLNAAMPFAQQLLVERDEFLPYAVLLKPDGSAGLMGVDLQREPLPTHDEALHGLYAAIPPQLDGLAAVAVVAHVHVTAPAPGPAVRVELEHRDGGPALVIFVPYARRQGQVEFAQMHLNEGTRHFWDT